MIVLKKGYLYTIYSICSTKGEMVSNWVSVRVFQNVEDSTPICEHSESRDMSRGLSFVTTGELHNFCELHE